VKDHELLSQISTKLNALIALSLRQLVEDRKFDHEGRKSGVGEQARFLSGLGLESKDIAEILGAPMSSVRSLLSPSRRK